MDVWQETNWFAVQAKPFCEKLATSCVAKLDVEVFLPRIKKEQLVCGVWRIVTKPLFPGYFFARLCPLLSLDSVRYARGVLRVVGVGCYPIPLDAEAIAALQGRVRPDGFIRLEPKPLLSGEIVAIEQGPFAGWIGKVERECDDGKRAVLLLEAIQQARVVIEKRWLTPVAQAT